MATTYHAEPSPPDFHATLDGSFMFGGPFEANFTCTLGIACFVGVDGLGLGPSNSLALVAGPEVACENVAEPGGLVAPDPSLGWFAGGVSGFRHAGTAYHLGTPRYLHESRICWAHEFAFGYTVPVGTIFLDGVAVGSYACTLGIPCAVVADGVNLAVTSAMRISSGSTCSEGFTYASERAALYYYTSKYASNYTSNSSNGSRYYTRNYSNASRALYQFPILRYANPIGTYKLCWTHDPELAAFEIDAGNVTVYGPAFNQSFVCFFDEMCEFDMNGTELLTKSLVTLIPHAGECESNRTSNLTAKVGLHLQHC